MTKLFLFGISFLSLIAGCATSPDSQRDVLNATKLCCSGYADMQVSARLDTEQVLEINADSPVFSFVGGRSYFSLLLLSEGMRGQSLMLRTFVGSPTITNSGGAHLYFLPAVTFLNTSREPIVTLNDERPIPELYGWSGTGSFVGKVRIPSTASFAIIHTSPAKLGQLYTGHVKSPGFTTMTGGVLISQGGGEAPMRAVLSSTGKVLVSIAP